MREKEERERGNYDNRLEKDGERDDKDEDDNNNNRADGSDDNADCNGYIKYQHNNQIER
jgi:hypothetical protein